MIYISPPLQILLSAFVAGVSVILSIIGVYITSALLLIFVPVAVLASIFMFITASELQKERIKDGHR